MDRSYVRDCEGHIDESRFHANDVYRYGVARSVVRFRRANPLLEATFSKVRA